MEFGLALAGGGTRGAAHVGVLMALEEAKLLPTSLAGTSAGSLVAGLYAAGVSTASLQELLGYLAKKGSRYIDVDCGGLLKFIPQMIRRRPVSLQGLIKGDRLLALMTRLTGGISIRELPLLTVIPAVDLNSGQTVAFTNGDRRGYLDNVQWETDVNLAQAMIASSSVPAIFRPRQIGDYCLVDGGVTHNLPVDLLVAAGEQRVIAVDIGEDYTQPKNDTIIDVVTHSYAVMSYTLKECNSMGERLLLKPKLPAEAGLLTFEQMEDCLEAGYTYTKAHIGEVSDALAASDRKRRAFHYSLR